MRLFVGDMNKDLSIHCSAQTAAKENLCTGKVPPEHEEVLIDVWVLPIRLSCVLSSEADIPFDELVELTGQASLTMQIELVQTLDRQES